MKIIYKINDKISMEFESTGQKEIFEELVKLEEVFGHGVCGACKTDAKFVIRTAQNDKGKQFLFYEMHCTNPKCRARLAFGQHAEGGTLFPKRKNDAGEYIENNGWARWRPENKEE